MKFFFFSNNFGSHIEFGILHSKMKICFKLSRYCFISGRIKINFNVFSLLFLDKAYININILDKSGLISEFLLPFLSIT